MNVIALEAPTQNSSQKLEVPHFQNAGNWHSSIEDGHIQLCGESENHDFYLTGPDRP